MSSPDDPSAKTSAASDHSDDEDELDRKAILARRTFFVRRVLVAAGAVAVGAAAASCQPCLRYAIDAERDPDASDASQGDEGDASPQPCLAPLPPDAGGDAGSSE